MPARDHVDNTTTDHYQRFDRMGLRELVRSDFKVYPSAADAFFSQGFWLVVTYRVAHRLHLAGWDVLARLLQASASLIFSCDISRRAVVGPGLMIPHPAGVFVAPYTRIGARAVLGAGTFLSCNRRGQDPRDYPTIGDWVVFTAGAKVFGPVVIGDKSWIGPNVVVLRDVPPESSVLPPEIRIFNRAKWRAQAKRRASANRPNPPCEPRGGDATVWTAPKEDLETELK